MAVMVCSLLAVGSAMADPTYWMTTGGNFGSGQIFTGDTANEELLSNGTAAGLLPAFGFTAPNKWDVAGYWTFRVTGSTANTPGSNWNEVFAGGDWYFDITWNGSVLDPQVGSIGKPIDMPVASFHQWATWSELYGNWFENNPGVYTYFKLINCDPSAACASDPNNPPQGVFAFVLDTQGGGNYSDFAMLSRLGDPVTGDGTGIATAAVPEPTTFVLLGLGLAGIAGLKLRKRS